MATEGSVVLQALQGSLQQAESAAAQAAAEAETLEGQARELLNRRGEALLELARHFLPEISRPAIEATFAGIRNDLSAILARKEKHAAGLRDAIASAEREAREHDAQIDDVTRRLNEKVALRERLETQVAETLKGHADFQERSKLALQAEEQLHRNEQRVGEMQTEAAEKLPHYQKSRLFRYLHARKFGTPDYQSTGLIRSLDRWVAKLIDYEDARNGYEFLIKAPELVSAEVSRRRDLFNDLMKQVEAIQKEEADRAGLTTVLQEGDALGTTRDRLVTEGEAIRQRAQGLRDELATLDRTENAFYTEAIERFRSFLGETKLALLERKARETPEQADDQLVAELVELDQRMTDLQGHSQDLAARREAVEQTRQGIDQVVRRFRQSNYDSQRSYFEDGFDAGRLLGRFADGMVDTEGVWSTIQSAQRFRPHWVETSAAGAGEVLASPAGRVLIGAVIGAANRALEDAAYRGVQRRGDSYYPPLPDMPPSYSPPPPAPPAEAPSAPTFEGGFTTGEGF
ncbi:MAG: hypothetical protein U0835_08380 [Isosphaeraceae bacterium]